MGDFLGGLDQEYAPGWKPEAGDTIQGIITDKDTRDGGYGEYPIITVLRITGPEGQEQLTTDRVAIHCMSTVLKDWATEKALAIGDRIAVRYNGKKPSPTRKNKDGSPVMFDDFSKTMQPAAMVPENLRPSAAHAVASGGGFLGGMDDEPF